MRNLRAVAPPIKFPVKITEIQAKRIPEIMPTTYIHEYKKCVSISLL